MHAKHVSLWKASREHTTCWRSCNVYVFIALQNHSYQWAWRLIQRTFFGMNTNPIFYLHFSSLHYFPSEVDPHAQRKKRRALQKHAMKTIVQSYAEIKWPIHWAPLHCVLTNHNATKYRQIRSDMRAHMLGARGRLCRKVLERLTCSCPHVRCGWSLMDRSIVQFYSAHTLNKSWDATIVPPRLRPCQSNKKIIVSFR